MSEQDALAPTRARHKVSNNSKSTKWTKEDDDALIQLVSNSPNQNWVELTRFFTDKTAQQISERWEKVLDPHLVKGSWTRREDQIIIDFVREHGVKNWTKLAEQLPGRIGKQCRERWRNHLDPDVNRNPWTPEEDDTLIKLHEEYGNQWVKIAESIPGRSDNSVKNRWNSTLKKRLEYQKTGSRPPRRGRPSRKNAPKSADDLPKPPRIDDVIPEIKETAQTPSITSTPLLLSPFTSLKSPFGLSPYKDMYGDTPRKDFEFLSPGLFSPMKNSNSEALGMLSPLFKK